jgi:hypothetical protein
LVKKIARGCASLRFRLLRATRACYADYVMVERERLPVPDTELSRPALVLAQRFVQRWDLHARQLEDGSYVCIHEPLNSGHLLDHLRGEITLGAYLLDQESRTRSVVLDADDAQAWEHLGHLARALADEDIVRNRDRLASVVSPRRRPGRGRGLVGGL